MDSKPFVIGTVVGGCTIFGAGLVLFALPPLNAFYDYALNAGSAAGVPRESPLLWAVFLGALAYGALVTLAIGSRTTRTGIATGMRVGAVVGFLLWFTADLMFFGISNVGSLASILVDPLIELVPGAIAGGMVALVLGRLGRQISHGAHEVRV